MSMKLLYTIKELASANGGPIPMSVSGIYNACKQGTIKTQKIGRRIFVSKKVVEEILGAKLQ